MKLTMDSNYKQLKYMYTSITSITDKYKTIIIYSYTVRTNQFSFARSPLPKGVDKLTRRAEYRHTIVIPFCYVHQVSTDTEPSWITELTPALSLLAKVIQVLAISAEQASNSRM